MSTISLTATQQSMLAHAIHHTDGRIDWFPENIKGGARPKVLQGLFNRALITPFGADWFVAAEGFDALGCTRPTVCSIAPNYELEATVALAEATWAKEVITEDSGVNESAPTDLPFTKLIRTHEHSKQATIIGMLQRAEGATIAQICEATGWQAHTVRGTFAGAFKKKMGMNITSDKAQGGVRTYRAAV